MRDGVFADAAVELDLGCDALVDGEFVVTLVAIADDFLDTDIALGEVLELDSGDFGHAVECEFMTDRELLVGVRFPTMAASASVSAHVERQHTVADCFVVDRILAICRVGRSHFHLAVEHPSLIHQTWRHRALADKIELKQRRVEEADRRVKQRDLEEARVEADPQKGIEPDGQRTTGVKQALRPVFQAVDDFAKAHLAVAPDIALRGMPRVIGGIGAQRRVVVEVEVDGHRDVADDPRLDQPTQTQRGTGKNARRQSHLGHVDAVHDVVVEEETVGRQVGVAQVEIHLMTIAGRQIPALAPFVDAVGVEAKAEIRRGFHRATKARIQAREDLKRLDVLELQFELGQVVDEQRHVLAGQQAEGLGRVTQQREAEGAAGGANLLRDRLTLRLVFRLVVRGIARTGLRRAGRTTRCRAGNRRGVLRCTCRAHVAADLEGTEVDQDRARLAFDEVAHRLDEHQHIGNRFDRLDDWCVFGLAEHHAAQAEQIGFAGRRAERHQQRNRRGQQLDDRIERLERAAHLANQRADEAADELGQIQLHVLERDHRSAAKGGHVQAGANRHIGKVLAVMEQRVQLRELQATEGRNADQNIQIDIGLGGEVDIDVNALAPRHIPAAIATGIDQVNAEGRTDRAGVVVRSKRAPFVVDQAAVRGEVVLDLQLQKAQRRLQRRLARGWVHQAGRQAQLELGVAGSRARGVDIDAVAVDPQAEREHIREVERHLGVDGQLDARQRDTEVNRQFLVEDRALEDDIELHVLGISHQLHLAGRGQRGVDIQPLGIERLQHQQVRPVAIQARAQLVEQRVANQINRRFARRGAVLQGLAQAVGVAGADLVAEQIDLQRVDEAGRFRQGIADHWQADLTEQRGELVLEPEHAFQTGQQVVGVVENREEVKRGREVRHHELHVGEAGGSERRAQ